MKKINSLLLFVLTIILCYTFSASAATDNDFHYAEKSDGTIEITSYNGDATQIVIPETIDGMAVTSIGEMAFYENLKVTEFILPETIKEIGLMAFQGCAYLEKINLPDTLELIKERAFVECKNLFVELPSEVKLENPYTLLNRCKGVRVSSDNKEYSSDSYGVLFNKDKTNLISYPSASDAESYTVPETVKVIGKGAFANAINLKSVSLPQGLEKIETEAFTGAILLETVKFPSTLKEIEELAFSFCASLDNLSLPDTIESIGFAAFAGSFSLKNTEIKSLDMVLGDMVIGFTDRLPAVEFEEWIKLSYAFADSIHGTQEYKTNRTNYYDATIMPEEGIAKYEPAKILCHSGSTAEAYAIENGINYELNHFMGNWIYDWENYIRERNCDFCDYKETEALEKSETGDIEIIKPENPDTEFEVEDLEKSDRFIVIENSVKENIGTDFTVLKAFDITLKNKDGVHVQPDGTVKVKLPLDWEKDANYRVYRVNDDGTLTDMNAYRQGSHMVFETDHFSIYIIVSEAEQLQEEEIKESKDLVSRLIGLLEDFFNLVLNFFKSL